MTQHPARKIVLAGYASDLAKIAPLFDAETISVDEDGFDRELPSVADVVVFALSRGACYSTQLHIVSVRVHDHVAAPHKYVLAVDDADLSDLVFPEIAALPRATLDEIRAIVAHSNL